MNKLRSGAVYSAPAGLGGLLLGDVASDGAGIGARETGDVSRRLVAPKCDDREGAAKAEAVGIFSRLPSLTAHPISCFTVVE